MTDTWYRVTRKRPCAICRRPDWCGYTDTAAICMRIQSDKPARNGGWLHTTDDRPRYAPPSPIRQAIPDKPLDAEGIWKRWFEATEYSHLDGLGMSLGVDTDALKAIGCAWAPTHNAWAIPMKDARGNVIGIRLRNDDGAKYAVKGSRQGLFLPTEYSFANDGTLFICEGPTDLAAAMTIGLHAIGRPACLGQEPLLIELVRVRKAKRVVIIVDNDDPGIRGAEKLQSMLPIFSAMWIPPCKDIREFVNAGGTPAMINASLKDTVWTRPREQAA